MYFDVNIHKKVNSLSQLPEISRNFQKFNSYFLEMEILKRQAHHLVLAKSNKTNRNQFAQTIQAIDQLMTNPTLAMIPILKR